MSFPYGQQIPLQGPSYTVYVISAVNDLRILPIGKKCNQLLAGHWLGTRRFLIGCRDILAILSMHP